MGDVKGDACRTLAIYNLRALTFIFLTSQFHVSAIIVKRKRLCATTAQPQTLREVTSSSEAHSALKNLPSCCISHYRVTLETTLEYLCAGNFVKWVSMAKHLHTRPR